MPLIVTIAVFRQNKNEIMWDLLPLTAEILDGVVTRHRRDGVVTAKIHGGTNVVNVISRMEDMLTSSVAGKASLIVFCQNGEVAETFVDKIRQDKKIKLIAQ